MKCVVLAAGFATRLYPLTRDRPKSLLPVAGRPVMDYLMDGIEEVDDVDQVILVTNSRFYDQFVAWLGQRRSCKATKVLNDGSTSPQERLGAVGDLHLAVQSTGLDDDFLVMASDNLFDFSLAPFVSFFKKLKAAAAITVREEPDPSKLVRTGVVELDKKGRVTHFEEKPSRPRSNLSAPPFYIFAKQALPFIGKYLSEKNNPDTPGHFLAWLHTRTPIYAFPLTECRHDIGDLQAYREINRLYATRPHRPR